MPQAVPFLALAVAAVGTVAQIKGAQRAADAQKEAQRLEVQRANLQSARERRNALRQSIVARANALTVGANQGAMDGSGIAAATGQAVSDGSYNMLGVNQGQELGRGIIRANGAYSNAQTMMATGAGLSSLGGAILNNSEAIGRVIQ